MTAAQSSVSLLFAEVLLFWHAANYIFTLETTRTPSALTAKRFIRLVYPAFFASAATFMVARGWAGALLAAMMLAGCILLPVARCSWVPPRYFAELEILSNAAVAALTQLAIAHFTMRVQWSLIRLPVSESRIAVYTVSASIMIVVVRGGTYIVRGILDRAGTMPPPELQTSSPGLTPPDRHDLQRALPVDTVELNHGRLIGNAERIIAVLFVANSQYTALAFFFAAKGMIRSKDVERRAWADYLILGSLPSFLVAVVAGLLIQAAFQAATG